AYAFIGAGAVVTSEVPDYAFMYGVPAKLKGWVSKAGSRLYFEDSSTAFCDKTGEKYELRDGAVFLVTSYDEGCYSSWSTSSIHKKRSCK
ncbi:hypothetical protein N9L53_01095, partial [Schleiferiaceae bacterium]|nr:hypothetical protein [Schleiferiaceae bacterium]